MDLKVLKLTTTAKLPTRAHFNASNEIECDVGCDLYSDQDVIIPSFNRRVINTGISIILPPGCYGRIAPRSGLACNNSIDVCAGVIDRSYRGELKVCLTNFGDFDFIVKKGMKIAQLICERVYYPNIVEIDEIPNTNRGTTGFGDSGL
jgi:dUTP pyrophosphatase